MDHMCSEHIYLLIRPFVPGTKTSQHILLFGAKSEIGKW